MAVTVTRTDRNGQTYTYDVKDQDTADLHRHMYGASVVQQPAVTANSQGQIPSNAGSTPTTGGTGSTSLTSGTGSPAGVTFTPNPTAPNLNQSQLTYFDNKYGGIGNYANTQNERYAGARATNNQELMDKIQADASRVGYALDNEKYSQNKQNLQPDYSWIDAFVNNELAQQRLALDQQLERHRGDAQNAVDQNNMFLQENLGRLNEQKLKTGQDIINFQNRRGGFYSGGVDYQTANNEKAFSEASSQLTRDIESRNANIWSNYNQLASQAAEKISLLQQQAPDRIRQLIQEQMAIDAGFTGNYNGQRTIAGQTLDLARENQTFNQNMDVNKFLYDQTRDARRDYESDRLFNYGVYRDNVGDKQWQQQFEKSSQQFAEQMGYNWASLGQKERQFIAEMTAREEDRSYQQLQNQFSRGLETFKLTGEMPDFMAAFGVNVAGLKNQTTRSEVLALMDDLASGAIKPADALKTIEQAERNGWKPAEVTAQLRNTVYEMFPENSPESEAVKKQKENARQKLISDTFGIMNYNPTFNLLNKGVQWFKSQWNKYY